jgi:hypothetical protein
MVKIRVKNPDLLCKLLQVLALQVGSECEWGNEKWRVPNVFKSTYPYIEVRLVSRQNLLEFL